VIRGEPLERRGHFVERAPHAPVAGDEIGVVVAQYRAVAVQVSVRNQVEEDGAAADEGFEVASHRVGIEAAQHRQELALAADPLQKWPQPHGHRLNSDPPIKHRTLRFI
jgi:hypothetical protein